jgi:DNA-binding transcriptional LysR family regulator
LNDPRSATPFRLLAIVGAMMRRGNTIEAAGALGLSQPAVSIGIRPLEKLIGRTLFERVHPTA